MWKVSYHLIKVDKENPLNPEELESITLTKRARNF